MAPGPLNVLQKGFISLSKNIQARKDDPESKHRQGETISESDELWLDNEGNTVDSEQQVLDTSKSASDYEISSWVKDEAEWRGLWSEHGQQSDQVTAKRTCQTEHPEIEEMMSLWVLKAMGDGILLTGETLRQKWNTFADMRGIPEDERLKLSKHWLESFKQQHQLKEMKRYGGPASAGATTVKKERNRMQGLIRESGYARRDIFKMDETGLFYGMAPDRSLSDRKHSGVKGKKTRLTYALISNADGSEKLPAFIIGKAARPRAFRKKTGTELGFYYRNNAKAWMTTHLYQEWIRKWDEELRGKERKILLLQDNFPGHVVPPDLQNIHVENFEPNLTAHVQPKDQGVIRCFKAIYRARFIERAVSRYDEGITPGEIYDINQLQAMRLADAAWRAVDTTTIRNCWRKAGILPDVDTSPSNAAPRALLRDCMHPAAYAEKQVENALDDLEKTGALQRRNRMDIESLLNPDGESLILTEVSDREIFRDVMGAVEAREKSGLHDSDDVEEVGEEIPPPTLREVIKAISTITRYIEDINDPVARQMEILLGTFRRQLRLNETKNMNVTLLTDHFTS